MQTIRELVSEAVRSQLDEEGVVILMRVAQRFLGCPAPVAVLEAFASAPPVKQRGSVYMKRQRIKLGIRLAFCLQAAIGRLPAGLRDHVMARISTPPGVDLEPLSESHAKELRASMGPWKDKGLYWSIVTDAVAAGLFWDKAAPQKGAVTTILHAKAKQGLRKFTKQLIGARK